MPTEQKKQIVSQIQQLLEPAQTVVFADFSGVPAPELEKLRNKLEEKEAYLHVTKNTLLNIASQKAGLGQLNEQVTSGPTVTLFCHGQSHSSIKDLYEYWRQNEVLDFKGGFLEGKPLSAAEVKTLAQLPSREIVLSQVMAGIQAPTHNLVHALQANLTNLVRVIGRIRESKED